MKEAFEILFVIYIWINMWLWSERINVRYKLFWYPVFALSIMVMFISMLFKGVGECKRISGATKYPLKSKRYERKINRNVTKLTRYN